MIKAAFFDIDGTLVSFNTHTIPQSTLNAISEIRKKGVKVFIATGRPLPFINNLGQLEYDGIMSVTGASCTTADGTIISQNTVSKEDIERLIADLKVHPMPVAFASDDKAIVTYLDADTKKFQDVFTLLNIELPPSQPIEKALDMNVTQIIAFFNEKEEPRIMRDVLKGCDANRWHPDFADCVAKGTNKATGIDAICKYYGIALNETVAFGDGGNDITMLHHAGVGVAMGNASDEVKQHADMITDTVDNDGIAKALKSLMELQ